MPINKKYYLNEQGIPHVTYDMVASFHSPKELEDFRKFMTGQTMMIRFDGLAGIYTWDYERWVNQGMRDKQGLDWD